MAGTLSRCGSWIGRLLAGYLTRPHRRYETFAATDVARLRAALQPGDVLLIEGNTRISTAIKYLTQSSWSHAALYVGNALAHHSQWQGELVEADLVNGVIAIPLSTYADFNTRICRPVGLSDTDRDRIVAQVISRLGHQYDLRNIIDLLRYLLPAPPVPSWMRRRMLAFGSGDPTRGICSTIIAEAFQSIRYPILPLSGTDCGDDGADCLKKRHYSHFVPRDFDLSPYFAVVKPTLAIGFDFRQLRWQPEAEASEPARARASSFAP